VVISCNRKYTLFNADGMPLRATVTLVLREYRTLEEQLNALNLQSSDHTRLHVVQEGEDLPLIAFQAYGKPSYWRTIADANNILNTRVLQAGAVLSLPPIV
jgi:nucleoid-associated protein YgaU